MTDDQPPFAGIAALAAKQDDVVTRKQLRQRNLGTDAIDRLAGRGLVQKLHRGVYVHGSATPTWEQQMLAAVEAGCSATRASHRGALAVYRVFPQSVIEVTVPYETEMTLTGVVVHRSRRPLNKARTVDGIRVTSLERALLDAASVCTEVELENAIESSLLQKKTTEERLWTVLVEQGGRGVTGTRRLRDVLENRPHGRPARSVLEVLTGRLLRRRGVRDFVRNHDVLGADGKSYELDFAFVDQLVVLEVDGKAYHSTASQVGRDKKRQRALEAAGWRFLRVGWFDVIRRPDWVIEQLRALLVG